MNQVLTLKKCKNCIYIDKLFNNFYQEIILKDDYLSKIFLQIDRYIKKEILIKNNKLCDLDGDPKDSFDIYILDRVGNLRNSQIIKSLYSQDYIYEIRINEEYSFHRILVFGFGKNIKLTFNEDTLIFSFGFSKTSNTKDFTDELAAESKIIYDEMKNRGIMGFV